MSIEEQFNEAQIKVKTLPAQSNENLLKLYSLFKQATKGDVSGKKPGMLDLVGKAKYDAWAALKGQSQEEAKQAYIDFVNGLANGA